MERPGDISLPQQRRKTLKKLENNRSWPLVISQNLNHHDIPGFSAIPKTCPRLSREMGKIGNKHYGTKYPIHHAQMAMGTNETKNWYPMPSDMGWKQKHAARCRVARDYEAKYPITARIGAKYIHRSAYPHINTISTYPHIRGTAYPQNPMTACS